MFEFGHLHRLPFIEHFEGRLLQIFHRMSVAKHRGGKLDQVDVDLLHELGRVDHHQIFDRRLRIVLERGYGAEVADAHALRNVDRLHERWSVQRGQARGVEVELYSIELLPLGDVHRHLHACFPVDLQRDAR